MKSTFAGDKPWPAVTAVCTGAGPRHAAVAFVGDKAPNLMPLAAGDLLVVNAGKAALKSHATSPSALQAYFDLGVEVYNDENLHAKVIATRDQAVIGSANASANSERLNEAVVITDLKTLVTQARDFVIGLAHARPPMDQDALDLAKALYASGRGRGAPPGTDAGDTPQVNETFPRDPGARMFFFGLQSVRYNRAVAQVVANSRGRARRGAGRASDYELDVMTDQPGQRADLREGDLLLRPWSNGSDADVWLSEVEVALPADRRNLVVWSRTPWSQVPLTVAELDAELRKLGFRPGLGKPREIRNPALRAEIRRLYH